MSDAINRRDFIYRSFVAAGAVNLLEIKASNPDFSELNQSQIPMPASILGRTGRKVSRLAFGGGSRYTDWVPEEKDAEKLIEYAISLGITYFDSAHSYGKDQLSEKRYGKYLTPKYRNQIFMTSKSEKRTYDEVMKEFEQTLTNMKTDHLDLYHMHALTKIEEVKTLLNPTGGFKAYRQLKEQGAIKNIGFSFHVWGEHAQLAFNEFDPDVVMCPLNAARDNECEEKFMPLALKKNIGLICMKVTAQNTLIGNVSGKDLVRYCFGLPAHVVNVGMDGYTTLESCVELAKEKPLSAAERDAIHKKLAYSPEKYKVPYHQSNYFDGYFA